MMQAYKLEVILKAISFLTLTILFLQKVTFSKKNNNCILSRKFTHVAHGFWSLYFAVWR